MKKGFLEDGYMEKVINYYIIYFFAILMPQILMISNKGGMFDTAYKGGVLISFVVVYFWFLHNKNALHISRNSAIWLITYILGAVIGAGIANELEFGTCFLIGIISVVYLCFISLASNVYIEKVEIDKFALCYVFLIIYACIFNLVKNGTQIVASLKMQGAGNFSSFFDNKNTFGLFLFCGIIATTLCLNRVKQRKIWYAALVFILINLIVSSSRTALFSSIAFLCIYYVFSNWKKPSVWMSAILLIGVLYYFTINVEFISTFLENHIFRNDSSMLDRNIMAQTTLQNISEWGWIFGYGENADSYMARYTGYAYFHNTFIEIIATGGIIKAFLYCILAIKAITMSIKIYKKESIKIGAIFIAAWISYFMYSFGESVVLLNGDTQGFIMTFLLLTLPQLYYNSYQKEERFYKYVRRK